MYGDEDNLLTKLGTVKNLLIANNMQERFRPVHVGLTSKPRFVPGLTILVGF